MNLRVVFDGEFYGWPTLHLATEMAGRDDCISRARAQFCW